MTIEDGSSANYIVVGHEPFSINNQLDQKVMQLTNNLTYVKGDHTYTLGFSYEKFEFDNSFNLGFMEALVMTLMVMVAAFASVAFGFCW